MSAEIERAVDAIADRVAERAAQLLDERLTGMVAETGDRWLSLDEAAKHCGVSPERLRKQRDVPRARWGGRVLFRRSELDAFLDRLTDPPRS